MTKTILEYQKISQKQEIDSAMIIFHGYGDSMAGFSDFAQYLSRFFPKTAFYLVNAPDSLMFGGYSWFSLNQEDFLAFEAPETAEQTLNNLIDRVPIDKVHKFTDFVAENENISHDKIVYAGFSQGGLISLIGGLTKEEKLGGIVAMSAVPLTFGKYFTVEDVKNTPEVLLTHGTGDTIVPFVCFEMSKSNLGKIGVKPSEEIVPRAEHNESITFEVLQKISVFLKDLGF